MVASYSSAQCVIYDLETAAPVVTLDSAKTYSKYARDSVSSQYPYVSSGFQIFHVKQSPSFWQIFVEAFYEILKSGP